MRLNRARQVPASVAVCALAAIAAVSGCARLRAAPAWDPYSHAPASAARMWPVPPTPAAPFTESTQSTAPPSPMPEVNVEKLYDVVALIDLAQHSNPETRASWEQARAAAAHLGLADSDYFPTLVLLAVGGYARVEDRTTDGPVFTAGPALTPLLVLEWTLLDFGRREARFERAAEELMGSNLEFNRTHQEVAYGVQRSVYAYDASRARVDAAVATLRSTTAIVEEAEARLARGLATRTELLLARQERARAAFDVQAARSDVDDRYAALAQVLGISPVIALKVAPIFDVPLPAQLSASVEQVIDRALRQRPDLGARLATLRARDADVRRARSAFWPTVGLAGAVGGTGGSFTAQGVDGSFDYAEPIYRGFLTFSWELFDGYARENRLRQAEAVRGRAAAELSLRQLEVLREVWKAYADVKAAFLQLDFAQALLVASQEAYNASFTGYRAGLNNIIDVLSAERVLAGARTQVVESRAELLTAAASLAFAAGDWQTVSGE